MATMFLINPKTGAVTLIFFYFVFKQPLECFVAFFWGGDASCM